MNSIRGITDPYQLAASAATELVAFTGVERYDASVVLGSGWSRAADALGEVVAEVPAHEIIGFHGSAVEGHTGMLRSIRSANGDMILLLAGRTHLYEGHGVNAVVHGVRVAAAAGARALVLTNGAGGIGSKVTAGSAMLISDHLNLTATSPLEGARFVDLTDLYSADARARVLARAAVANPSSGLPVSGLPVSGLPVSGLPVSGLPVSGLPLSEGVYAQLPGPHYETPAEIAYLRTVGADAVGMSTALEAIAARELGLSVLGISLITNLAAGTPDASGSAQPLNHEEVLEAGRKAAEQLGPLLNVAVEELLRELPA